MGVESIERSASLSVIAGCKNSKSLDICSIVKKPEFKTLTVEYQYKKKKKKEFASEEIFTGS